MESLIGQSDLILGDLDLDLTLDEPKVQIN